MNKSDFAMDNVQNWASQKCYHTLFAMFPPESFRAVELKICALRYQRFVEVYQLESVSQMNLNVVAKPYKEQRRQVAMLSSSNEVVNVTQHPANGFWAWLKRILAQWRWWQETASDFLFSSFIPTLDKFSTSGFLVLKRNGVPSPSKSANWD